MRIGIPREIKPGECRVAVTPSGVRAIRDSGAEIVMEADAGAASGFGDREYRDAGGTIAPTRDGHVTCARVAKVFGKPHLAAREAIR